MHIHSSGMVWNNSTSGWNYQFNRGKYLQYLLMEAGMYKHLCL